MRRAHLARDIKPISEFRASAAVLIQRVRKEKRPLVLTHRGHGAAVVLDVEAYEDLLEELEILRDVQAADAQLDAGRGIPHEKARRKALKAIAR